MQINTVNVQLLIFRPKNLAGWVGRWMDGWMDGWVGGWVDRWMEGKAGLKIAYSNQKVGKIHNKIVKFEIPNFECVCRMKKGRVN